MSKKNNGFLYELCIFCFNFVSKIMRQKPHLQGKENLQNLPGPVIFTVTHDSYFEIPSLSKVYYSLKPRPGFLIMGKDDFLSGSYLASNFGKKSRVLKSLFTLLDKTGLPVAFFRKMRLITIHRPFIESYSRKKAVIRNEIGEKMSQFKTELKDGMSTLIFPEGTTWGYGGLKRLRSGIYQLVSGAYTNFKRKVYILPINVKVDRCVKGKKDIFIRVGKPEFFVRSAESFNHHLEKIMKGLHTITLSQIASFYLRRLAELYDARQVPLKITRDDLRRELEAVVSKTASMVKGRRLPHIDEGLFDSHYLAKKTDAFIKFCLDTGYILKNSEGDTRITFIVNAKRILDMHSMKTFRKLNPLGFSANELLSLGEDKIRHLFDGVIKDTVPA